MPKEIEYKPIVLEQLGEKRLFPFELYLKCPMTQEIHSFLPANTPLTKTKLKVLEEELARNKALLIEAARSTLLQEIAPLAPRIKTVKKAFDVDMLVDAFYRNNFLAIINFAREHIAIRNKQDTAISVMMLKLTQDLFIEDNLTNRSAALAYALVILDNEFDENAWCDTLSAAFFANLGQTTLEGSTDHSSRLWQKHSNLSLQLIRKAQLPLSDRCRRIIEQHHEYYDGSGFPHMRQGSAIDPLALMLNLAFTLSENSFQMNAQDFFVFLTSLRPQAMQKYGPRVGMLAQDIIEAVLKKSIS